MIAENVRGILREIEGGNALGEKITLVAATKTRSADEINEAIEAGVTDIGENKVQEFTQKFDYVHGARRHFIGHLQTNKVKYLIGKTDLIQSLDRFELADELQKRAEKAAWTADCLLEVNIGSELSKSGFSPDEAFDAYKKIGANFRNLRLRGLMAMLPLALRKDDPLCAYLSMGMSGDWRLCAANGSNMIRLGTTLFGERHYPA